MTLKPVSTYERVPEEHTYAADGSGKRVCGARTREGSPCQMVPMQPGGRCKTHGGKASQKVGIAHHNFKNGRYSKHVKGALSMLYEEARNDENWLSLQEEIHLIDAQIMALFENVDEETGEHIFSQKMLNNLIESKRKLIDTERRRIVEAQGMMPIDKVRGIVRLLIDIIREHVRDERVLMAIQRDLQKYL